MQWKTKQPGMSLTCVLGHSDFLVSFNFSAKKSNSDLVKADQLSKPEHLARLLKVSEGSYKDAVSSILTEMGLSDAPATQQRGKP